MKSNTMPGCQAGHTQPLNGRTSAIRGFLCGSLVLGLFVGAANQVQSAYIYWGDFNGGTIRRANLDGAGPITLVSGLSNPLGPALDVARGQMYWGDAAGANIWRANLDGTRQTNLISGLNGPGAPALDLAGGRMYWSSHGGDIRRANLDGTGQQVLVTGLNGPHSPVLDLAAGKIYWTDFEGGDIRRVNLDGTGQQILVTGLSSPSLMALDIADGKMYWSGQGSGDIRRANLDGSGQQTLVQNLNAPSGIALDLGNRHLYWTDAGGGDIRRANLDGSDQQILITGLNGPGVIALDIDTGPPLIQSQPQSKSAPLDGPVTFTVGTVGSKPMFYQWRFNHVPLAAGTNSLLTLSHVTTSDAGSYSVLVSNSLGSVTSQTAMLNVAPIIITSQTGNTNVWPGSNVVFQVRITSTVPVNCQWRFNSTDIPGATNLIYSLTNVQLFHEGEYTAVLINSHGSVTSAPASLVVLIRPLITQPPQSQTIVAGEDATFNVIAGGSLPITFEWRRTSAPLATNTVFDHSNSFTLFNVGTNQSGNYRVVVRNAALPSGVASSFVTLSVLPATAPTAMTEAATGVAAEGATLHGTVNPNGAPSVAFFEYGVSASYGSRTPDSFLAKDYNAVPVSQTLTGLLAGATYHYRLVATNHGGISLGADKFFTTAPVVLRISRLEPVGNGHFRLSFAGTNGTVYTVLASTNLATWTALGAASPTGPASFGFIDTEAPGHPTRFYRLVRP